ncbi:4-hydroxy-tetrahydrodipicolinate synthase [hydrothermal vent metagenome]|uniref:4-hydroxy-tetrahydrodipicolinate synthase n=1 Tax=hydrothermal vent metagenome TaxID=652676 RepID=A0A3B0U5N2_9ZZZZ
MSKLFTGAGVALITPFKNDYSIDYDALGQIIENQVAGGMDYLVALGTTGEPPTLSGKEKNDVVRFIIEKSGGRLPVVVGMGGNSTQAVIDNIKDFNLKGASGLLIVTPYYNKPSQEGLYRHFKAVAEESPLPVILYNVPSRTGVNMEAGTVVRLAEVSEKIVAVKEASGIMSQLTAIKKYTPKDFTLISGDDVLALPIVSIGGEGVISVIANALPGKLSSLIHKAMSNDFEGALKLHLQMIDLFKLIFREGNPGGIKALLHSQGIIENVLRLPLYKVGDETYRLISEAFKKMK